MRTSHGPEREACEGKSPFPTRNLAQRRIQVMLSDRRNDPGVRFVVYRCRHCGQYHIGSETK